jgi:alpha-beta hydrolase superfamily lysophospholipase
MNTLYQSIETERYAIPYKHCLPNGEIRGVVLGVHGFASSKDSATQRAVAKTAVRQNLAAICFDFPAHGDSPIGEECFTVENCKQDLLSAAKHCREQYSDVPKYLFASSFGGYMTLLCKDDLPEFRMVLRAPAVTMGEHVLLDLLETTEEAFRQRGTIPFGAGRPLNVPFRFYEELQNRPVMQQACDQPVLIVHGNQDEVVPYDDVVRFCSAHPTVQLCTLYGAGHEFAAEEMNDAMRYATQFWISGAVLMP